MTVRRVARCFHAQAFSRRPGLALGGLRGRGGQSCEDGKLPVSIDHADDVMGRQVREVIFDAMHEARGGRAEDHSGDDVDLGFAQYRVVDGRFEFHASPPTTYSGPLTINTLLSINVNVVVSLSQS